LISPPLISAKIRVLIASGRQTLMQLGERFFRIIVEQVVEPKIEQLPGRKRTGLVGVQGIGGEFELRRALIGAGYSDGSSAARSYERIATYHERAAF
jgi:hypothetical protein